MSNNWDLFILFPVILTIAISGFIYIYYQKIKANYFVTNKKILLSLGSTFVFWIIFSLIIFRPSPELNNSSEIIKYFLLSSPILYACIFSYPINRLSRLMKSRKIIIISAFISAGIGAIFNFWLPPESFNLPILIFSAIFFGYTLAAFSIFFFAHNEHPYLRVEPLKSLEVTAPLAGIGIVTGFWFSSLFTDLINTSNGGSLLNIPNVIVSLVIIILSSIGLFLSLFFVERKSIINIWSDRVIPGILKPAKRKNIFYLVLISTIVIFITSITGNYMLFNLTDDSVQIQRISVGFEVLGILIAAFITNLILKFKISLKHLINAALAVMTMYLVIVSFATDDWVISIVSLFRGIGTGILLFVFIILAINWEYRTKKISVAGVLFSMWFLTLLVTNIIINYLFSANDYKVLDNNVSTLFFSTFASMTLFLIILNFFTSRYFLGEYFDLFLYVQSTKYKLRQVNVEELNISLFNSNDIILESRFKISDYKTSRQQNKKYKKATGQKLKKNNTYNLIKKQNSVIKKVATSKEKISKTNKNSNSTKSIEPKTTTSKSKPKKTTTATKDKSTKKADKK